MALGAALCFCYAVSTRAFAAAESIAGTVTDVSTHAGLAGVEVCAWKISGSEAEQAQERCVFSATGGNYEITHTTGGTYKVEFRPRGDDLNYIPQYYNHKRYWEEASPVFTGGMSMQNIDAGLQEGGEIEGRVVSEVGGSPIEGLLVCAVRWPEDNEAGCDLTGPDGKYRIIGLEERDYLVEFIPEYNGLKFLGEYYGDAHIWWMSDEVPVSVGEVATEIDAKLEPASEIQGEVTLAASGAPLAGIIVCIAPPLDYSYYYFFDYGQCKKTNDAGEYAFGSLEAGQYKAMFSVELWEYVHMIPPLKPEPDDYPTVYWNEKPTWEEAEAITLTAPTIAIADARLGPAAPASPGVSLPTQASLAAPRRPKRRCRPGFTRMRRKGGKHRCVRRRSHRHYRHRHRSSRPRFGAGVAEPRSGDDLAQVLMEKAAGRKDPHPPH